MNDPLFLKQYGPWALVAGASKGLGAEYARQLAEKGFNLVLVARQSDLLNTLSTELHNRHRVQVRPFVFDLSHPDSARQIFEQTADLEIGLFIYNAAIAPVATFFNQPLEQHLQMIETNMRTPLSLVYAFGRIMQIRHKGGIILMSSLSAMQGSALISHYAATKAYNAVLAEGLWDELRQDGVSVIASLPASIATPHYLADLPQGKRSPTPALLPQQVVTETLAALGKQSMVVPGWRNRLSAFFLRLLPREWVVRLMGQVLRDMYSKS
jgi:short-subunit dehydrogenase